MKKAMSVLLALVMIFCMVPVNAFAVNTAQIRFETDFTNELVVGEVFTVTAYLDSNPGMATITLSMDWNDQVLAFEGFDKYEDDFPISGVFETRGWTVVADDNSGVVIATRTSNDTSTGTLFTANFRIIGDGALGLGLKMDSGAEFQMKNLDSEDLNPSVDLSAISNLTVGGKVVGPVIPDGAPFSAVTADVEGEIIVEKTEDDVFVSPYGPTMPEYGYDVAHYHITVPEGTETVYIRYDNDLSGFTTQSFIYSEDAIGAVHASVNHEHEDVGMEFESGMAELRYTEVGENYTVIEFPITEFPGDLGDNDFVPRSALKTYEEDDGYLYEVLYYAVGPCGPESLGSVATAVFSFEYGAASEDDDAEPTYSITVEQPTTGGTVAVYNEESQQITKAVENQYIQIAAQAEAGYKLTKILVDDEEVVLMDNNFYKMPGKDIVVSAVFELIPPTTYAVTINDAVNGAVTADKATAAAGEQVALTVTPATGYELDTLTVKQGETEIEVINNAFSMPAGAVTVSATFKKTVAGYRFATSADVSAENGGTAVVKVMITGHSDPNVTKYNAYDITLTYDNDKLEYQDYAGAVLSDNGRVEVDEDNGTIRIVGCGADKDFGTEIAALTFKAKGEGQANVTIDKVQVSDKETAVDDNIPAASAKHEDDDTSADETPDVSIVVVPYSVTKPDFISGNDKILHSEDYTFSYTDTTNYTYSDLTVKVGGVAVENLTADENGVYTIANVTGAIEITATQTPNSYDVTKPENVTGPDKATYGTDYVFTVTPSKEDMAIDTVTVKYADGSEVPYTVNENGEYVIAGTDITGAFTITVTEKEKMTTITFSGIEEDEIDGGKLTMAAEIGKDFTFQLIKKEGFDYTVKVGETELTESKEVAGQYTIPAEQVVKGGVTVAIEKVDNTTATVDVVEYINLDGKTMFLVTAKWGEKVLAYGEGNTMFWSDKYTVTGEEEAGAYCWLIVSTDEMNTVELVKAAAEAAIVEAAEGTTATSIKYNYDINVTTKVDVNDAQLAYDMYNASYMDFTENLPMLKFLEADVKTDSKLDTQDVAAIISFIVSGANA